jgi:tetratricopeptide (TPR) repeat protein
MVAHSLNRLGNWQLNREQPQEAIARHREALRILEELGNTHGVAATLDLLGMATALASDRSEATRWYERAVSLWREIGDRQGLAESLVGSAQWAHSYHSDTLPAVGTLDQVRPLGEESLTISREIGWRAGESFALWAYRGNVLGAAGEYAIAVPSTWEALTIARAIDHAQWITGARCILGDLYADLGNLAAAREELRGALALAQEIASPYWVRSAAAKLVSALVVGGHLGEAKEVLDEHVKDAPMDTLASRILWCSAADLALGSGDPQRALTLADRLVKTVPGTAIRAIPRLELLRGQALTVLGRHDEAERALEAGREAAIWCSARPLLWRILAAQGELAHERGQTAEARRASAAAQSLLAELAAGIPDDALRVRFLDRSQETMTWAAPASATEITG